ncbi:MAG: DUF1844 domain-containing protein [Planctomycetota bacterium]
MNNPEENESEPKIIVDDDWKTQVEKEKQQAAAGSKADETLTPKSSDNDPLGDASPPPATLEVHLSMMFTQCMAALGQVPGADGKPGEINKPFAKYFIDTVEMLEQKTEGNRSEEETKAFSEMLHAMRMAFVSVR